VFAGITGVASSSDTIIGGTTSGTANCAQRAREQRCAVMTRSIPVAETMDLSRTCWSRLRCNCTIPGVSQATPAIPAVAPLGPFRLLSCAGPSGLFGSGDSRETVLAKRRERRLAERLAKPAYVNSDACCRDGSAGLAYESALLGNRSELIRCADITLAEHLALLMAMHDAESKLSGRVVFRVDSAAVLDRQRGAYPELEDAKSQIACLLERHSEWTLVLVERERNWAAHNLATRSLRDDA